jgi:cyclophilin family peptidyl-prolyl cis-trans isomerase
MLAGCVGDKKLASKDSDTGEANANIRRGVKPVADTEVAVIETSYGKIVLELYPNIAPLMVERFEQLAKDGFYNETTFHRVNPGLGIIQGGDPLSKDNNPDNDGTGKSPHPDVPAELSDIPYERGIVGAARAQTLDSANCQFFITLKSVPEFDQNYTVFGRVIKGMDVANVIANAPVAPGTERPSDKIVIKSITIQRKP